MKIFSWIKTKIWRILPLLSISISISCLLILLSLVLTVKKELLKDIEDKGATILKMEGSIRIQNSTSPDTTPPYSRAWQEITPKDILYLKRNCKEIKRIAIHHFPNQSKFGGGYDTKVKGEKDFQFSTIQKPLGLSSSQELWGISLEYINIQGLRVIKGRGFNLTDERLKRRVCVLGNTLYSELGGPKIIGKKIVVKGHNNEKCYNYIREKQEEEGDSFMPDKSDMKVIEKFEPQPVDLAFTVVGALSRAKPFIIPFISKSKRFVGAPEHTGGLLDWLDNTFGGDNGSIFIPYTTQVELIPCDDGKECMIEIYIQLALDKFPSNFSPTEKIKRGKEKIVNLFKKRYGEDKTVDIRESGRLLDELTMQSKDATIFITTISIITLIASIISILSLMLLSVHNRRNEIGLRRAIGARKKDIFLQFLKEALIITTKGGAVGIILGLFLVWLMGKYTGWDMVIPIYSLFLSIATIALIGVISGVYPALKAANIPPAVAVKYE